MTIVKPGDIILFKRHSWWQRFKLFLLGREIPYNRFFLVPANGYVDLDKPYKIYRLKTPLSPKEEKLFKASYKAYINRNVPYDDVFISVNIVRPETFSAYDFTPESISNNKSYKLLLEHAKEERRQINIHSLWK